MSQIRVCALLLIWSGTFMSGSLSAQTAGRVSRDDALLGLKRAATFYREKVASHGGYVYYYSADLAQRWGEGKASVDTIFVQPPGTPTVGLAYLTAYQATKDRFYLDAAREAALALVYGQLESGGWTQTIHFVPVKGAGKYRGGRGGSRNTSSLDDGQTQSALQLLMQADRALEFKDEKIHEAVQYGLNALLKAQFPNGAFPQVWTGAVEARPIVQAKYPTGDWKTEGRIKNYWDQYTLNDDLAGTVCDTLIMAHEVYGDAKFKSAVKKLGDFLILAQMPEPQPGWCQQYNADMVPIWARKFEPPAITGWESQDVMETLIKISRYTGDKKYLGPIPSALAYYRQRLLPDGRVARYYEFRTDKPLYMTTDYRLTYDDSAVPPHYGWKQSARFDAIEKEYTRAKLIGEPGHRPNSGLLGGRELSRSMQAREDEAEKILHQLDTEGRWVSTYAGEPLVGQPKFAAGFRYISSDVFRQGVEKLSNFIANSNR